LLSSLLCQMLVFYNIFSRFGAEHKYILILKNLKLHASMYVHKVTDGGVILDKKY